MRPFFDCCLFEIGVETETEIEVGAIGTFFLQERWSTLKVDIPRTNPAELLVVPKKLGP